MAPQKQMSAPTMERFLSEERVVEIVELVRGAGDGPASTSEGHVRARGMIRDALNMAARDPLSERRADILADLLFSALQESVAMHFSARQASIFVSLVRVLHSRSCDERLTIEASFRLLQDLLVLFSVHRPPFSEGVFSADEARAIMDWTMSAYYR